MERYMKGLYAVNKVFFAVSIACLAASTILAAVNAIARKIPGIGGFTWAEEMATYFCVLMLFIGVAYLELTNKQLTIGIIDNIVKNERARLILSQALRIFRGLLTIFLLSYVLRYGFVVVESLWQGQVLTFALRVPKVYFFIPMLLGFGMTILCWVSMLICNKGMGVDHGDK